MGGTVGRVAAGVFTLGGSELVRATTGARGVEAAVGGLFPVAFLAEQGVKAATGAVLGQPVGLGTLTGLDRPDLPTPPAPPTAPKIEEIDKQARVAASDALRRRRRARGFQSTIMPGRFNTTDDSPLARPAGGGATLGTKKTLGA